MATLGGLWVCGYLAPLPFCVPASVLGARQPCQTGLSFPWCLNWVLGARLIPRGLFCLGWHGRWVVEAAGEDVMWGKQERWGVVYFSPVASHPRGTKENVNANVPACYRKQYPLAIICTSICEEREAAGREKKTGGDGASSGWN